MGAARRLVGVVCATLLLGACASAPPKSSRLTVDDLEATTTEIAQRLSSSDWLSSRTPESPPVVIAIDKVQNLTSDLIPSSEQWWMMARLRDGLNVSALRRDRNVRFVIPQEYLRDAIEAGRLPPETGEQRRPTHAMEGTFRSLTRTAGKDRTDAYMFETRITEIQTGEQVAQENFEFKRIAFGRAYD